MCWKYSKSKKLKKFFEENYNVTLKEVKMAFMREEKK